MRREVCRILREEGLDPVAVENPIHPGTPDVNCTLGWIELKEVPARTRRNVGSSVQVPTFSNEQRVWLRRRWCAGRDAVMLLKVGQRWILLDGDVASEIVGKATEADLVAAARQVFEGRKALAGGLASVLDEEGWCEPA